jgi:secondary thiamine-phosphate synthase enzyme
MRTHHEECPAVTTRNLDFVDITTDVEAILGSSGIRDGHVTVFSREHGCSLIINEHEHGLWTDLRSTLERLEKEHPDELRASIGSASVVLPAVGGRLHLGMWQRLLLVELEDGEENAKDRSVHVQIVGD